VLVGGEAGIIRREGRASVEASTVVKMGKKEHLGSGGFKREKKTRARILYEKERLNFCAWDWTEKATRAGWKKHEAAGKRLEEKITYGREKTKKKPGP